MTCYDPAAAPLALRLRGLRKSYGAAMPAVADLDLDVAPGRMTVLLGAAGAGKTTTLKLIAGLEQPDAGQVWLAGRDMTRAEPRARDVAMIFDNLALYPNLTGAENLGYPLRRAKLPEEEIRRRVRDMAELLRIAHVLGRLPKTMSGGEKQRVALGRALVRDPTLCLLDEPLSSLDAMLRIELRAELRRLQREQGRSFLLATPDLQEALAIADQVVMLRRGEVVQVAPPQELYDFPADIETARFVGAPPINLLAAAHDGAGLVLGGRIWPSAGFRAPDALRFTAGIRPEHLVLCRAGEGTYDGIVTDVEPLGHLVALSVDVAGTPLCLTVPAGRGLDIALGAPVGLSLVASGVLAFDPVSGKLLTPRKSS